jgi:hypothetical protein
MLFSGIDEISTVGKTDGSLGSFAPSLTREDKYFTAVYICTMDGRRVSSARSFNHSSFCNQDFQPFITK